MGAFMLFQNGIDLDTDKASKLMLNKGFKKPVEFDFGEWRLWLYPKLMAETPMLFQEGTNGVYAVGAFTYRGLSPEASLQALLYDEIAGKLDCRSLFGHFTLIFHIADKIMLMGDQNGTKHVLTNKENSVFSSSMLAVAATCQRLTTNEMAVYEKCLTGIITSPDTIFNEVISIGRETAAKITSNMRGISFYEWARDGKAASYHAGTLAESAATQGHNLTKYLEKWMSCLNGGKADLGLSGGYDSTLLFAALYPILGENLHIHTHSTGHIHDQEKKAAQDITKSKGLDCRIVPTERFDEMDSDPTSLLFENLLFFDGRTSFDIGGFSPTYTANYRKNVTEDSGLTFTGVGGEAYRNHYCIVGKMVSLENFFKNCIFNPHFKTALRDEAVYQKTVDFHLDKCEKILGIPLRGRTGMLTVRRYYSEIMMPEGQGHVLDAYNTVSCCVAPFLEKCLLDEAYKGLPFLGSHGEYEAAIIKSLDPETANHMSSYGYAFDSVPNKQRVKNYIRARIPNNVWAWLSQNVREQDNSAKEATYLNKTLGRSSVLKHAYNNFEKSFDDIDFNEVIKGSGMVANLSYLALALKYAENGMEGGI